MASPTSFIGRSANASGQQFRGRIKDFRIYSKELTASQVKALSDETAPGNLAELKASVDLGDTSAVTRNLTLPAVPGVAWSSSNPAVVTALGAVTRPAAGQGDGARHADGHLQLSRPDGHQGVPGDGQAAGRVHAASSSPPGSSHYYKLDETAGTTLADSGSAGAAGNATLVNPSKATLTGAGVTLNPDAYADSLTGAYVDLPDNITAGMTDLTVDYDIRIDPANVGDHHLWSFGRKTNCDGDGQRRLRRLDLRLQHDAPPHRPERDDADHGLERAADDDLRPARGRVEAPDLHPAAQRERDELDRHPLRGRRRDRPRPRT